MITAPKQLTPYTDKDQDCLKAMASTFNQVLHLAEQYGWTRQEAAAAIQELAYQHLAAEEETRLTTISSAVTSHARH
ncbi:hypothetical protein [Pararhizobium qamdonense]|uniref:hypothetical protein n=1 Tax=Pararhizobium qamdonense TaxID=3031126 RepID=UPI0023E0C7CE|nr:hypothetical protein [Pararhizobium qamdonense]